MSKTVACIIARTVSSRLPLKVLRNVVGDLSMLDYLLQRVRSVNKIDEVYLCTSLEPEDDILEDVAKKNGVQLYRGSADAVIERMLAVAEKTNATNLLRITGDNVFTSVEFIDQQIEFMNDKMLDYVRVIDVPIGATAEVMTTEALKTCYGQMDPDVSEYLMLYMFEPKNFKCGVVKPFEKNYASTSLTVDTPQDLERTRKIFKLLGKEDPINLKLRDILDVALEKKLEHFHVTPSGMVKLPYGKKITYQEFAADMDRRVQESKRLNLFRV